MIASIEISLIFSLKTSKYSAAVMHTDHHNPARPHKIVEQGGLTANPWKIENFSLGVSTLIHLR